MIFANRSWISSDGLQLSARDYTSKGGGSAPVICLHGLTRNARDFEPLAPVLASDGRRVLAPDVRGRPRTGRLVPKPRSGHLCFAGVRP